MGFWHTGYMDFHEPAEEVRPRPEPRPPTFPCSLCGLEFLSERDLRVHSFEGHPQHRPVLVFGGRECGRSRLTVTGTTTPSDWVFQDADTVRINGDGSSVRDAAQILSSKRSGVVDVTLTNGSVSHDFQFEFALANATDLDGVDAALERLIAGAELSPRAVSDFILRAEPFPTASKYRSGLASYLYGVIARENAAESDSPAASLDGEGYEAKYDKAVNILGTFDRAPAEAICGLVAFHYNQFDRAMKKTKSQRVAEVSMRFQGMLNTEIEPRGVLPATRHPSLDFALSDSVIEEVLSWCALPIDGTASPEAVAAMIATIEHQRPPDQMKLRLIAAEHHLGTGDLPTSARHAEFLRHSRSTEGWYADFRHRLERASQQ
jgi:hypothetical protein